MVLGIALALAPFPPESRKLWPAPLIAPDSYRLYPLATSTGDPAVSEPPPDGSSVMFLRPERAARRRHDADVVGDAAVVDLKLALRHVGVGRPRRLVEDAEIAVGKDQSAEKLFCSRGPGG